MAEKFPVGGPRQPVYDALRDAGFVMAKYSDKVWWKGDVCLSVYGSGSMGRVSMDNPLAVEFEGPLEEAIAYASK